jgi:hypothetical protein
MMDSFLYEWAKSIPFPEKNTRFFMAPAACRTLAEPKFTGGHAESKKNTTPGGLCFF